MKHCFLIVLIAVAFFGPVFINTASAQAACDIRDLAPPNASYTISIEPAIIKPSTNFKVTATLSFQNPQRAAQCQFESIYFDFAYFDQGRLPLNSGDPILADPATIGGQPAFTATDNQNWSRLSLDRQLSAKTVIDFSLGASLGGLTQTGVANTKITVQPDSVTVGPGGAASGPAGAAGTKAGNASTTAAQGPAAVSSGNCVKQFGEGYVTIPGTSICVPKGPGSEGTIAGSDSIFKIIAVVIRILLILAGALAVLFLIIGGFWYLTSAGNEEQATKGKKALMYSILGLVIIVLSYSIVSIVVRTLTSTPQEIIGGSSSTSSGGTPSPGGGPDTTTPPGPPGPGTPNP